MKASQLKVIHLPFIIGNNAWYLSKYEKPLVSQSVVAYFAYSYKVDLFNELNYDLKIEFKSKCSAVFKIIMFYMWAIPRFDVFHFNGGSSLVIADNNSFIDFIDLRILKIFNKKIVITYQGSTGRTKNFFLGRLDEASDKYNQLFGSSPKEIIKQRRIDLVNKYSDFIYCTNPDLLYNFNVNKSMFRPYTKMDIIKPKKKVFNRKLRFVHFPTSREKKGTVIIDKVISEIIKEGYDIEYTSLSALSYLKVRELINSSDILIDQLLIGWYGGIAIEALNFGVPVIAYINEKDLGFIPENMKRDLPIINANSKNLKSVLINIIENPINLSKISQNGYRFISKWHNPQNIASKIVKDYEKLFASF